jgi:RNA polymerase sigma-70 factor (ECF subfamily)
MMGSNPRGPAGILQVVESRTAVDDMVERARAGDRAAFDTLYAQHVGRVYAVCLRMSGDRATAERLTQDAFVRAWQRLGTFRGDAAFGSWLHRLAVNVVLMDGRAESRRRAHIDPLADTSLLARSSDNGATETRLDLERAIATLPPGARAVLVLHDVEGYRQQEIADTMGIAVGTVKAQLHRARRLLRERLER